MRSVDSIGSLICVGSAISRKSRVLPKNTCRPSFISNTLSGLRRSASSTRCSTIMTVRPLARKPVISSSSSSTARASRLANGSSNKYSTGFITRIPAAATCWRCPPERANVACPMYCFRCNCSNTLEIRSSISARGVFKFSMPKATSCSTVLAMICLSGSCSMVPTSCARSRSVNPLIGRPPSCISPLSIP